MPTYGKSYGGRTVKLTTREEYKAQPRNPGVRSWQAAEKLQKQEAARELRAVLELLDTGCSPACGNCALGIHDGEDADGNCTCCGSAIWPD